MKTITYEDYPTYHKCLCKLVHKWAKRSRFGFDELMSEANMGFIKAVDTFNPDKACFHTHCFITVNRKLIEFVRKTDSLSEGRPINYTSKHSWEMEDYNEDLYAGSDNPEQANTLKMLIENLSKEAKEVVDTVLNTPLEMIELVRKMSSNRQGHMHVYKSNVTRFFKTKGWTNKQISSAFTEIKSIL